MSGSAFSYVGRMSDDTDRGRKEKKETEFQIAYQKGTELFLAKGYGRQMSGGYSIQVKELSASSNAVFFETKLIGPTEKIQGGEPSYPYIVIKTEYRDGPVQFQCKTGHWTYDSE